MRILFVSWGRVNYFVSRLSEIEQRLDCFFLYIYFLYILTVVQNKTFEWKMYVFSGYALFQDLRVLFVPWIFVMILATIVDVAHAVYMYGLDTVNIHDFYTITSVVIRSVKINGKSDLYSKLGCVTVLRERRIIWTQPPGNVGETYTLNVHTYVSDPLPLNYYSRSVGKLLNNLVNIRSLLNLTLHSDTIWG